MPHARDGALAFMFGYARSSPGDGLRRFFETVYEVTVSVVKNPVVLDQFHNQSCRRRCAIAHPPLGVLFICWWFN